MIDRNIVSEGATPKVPTRIQAHCQPIRASVSYGVVTQSSRYDLVHDGGTVEAYDASNMTDEVEQGNPQSVSGALETAFFYTLRLLTQIYGCANSARMLQC